MKKIDLDKLKVQSFVTSLDSPKGQTIKGGDETGKTLCHGGCYSDVQGCGLTDGQSCGGVDTCDAQCQSALHACITEFLDPNCRTTTETSNFPGCED